MAHGLPQYVNTVIVGGGPSSLILSYLLHGHIPYYSKTHHDSLLHSKLSKEPNLLKITPEAYAHFYSSLRYSTQALPLNTLLDTLIRPNADTEVNPASCVTWEYESERAVSHVVLSSAEQPGGQWVENPVSASRDIGTLSYSEMLSLPGYTYAEHYASRNNAILPDLQRPSRTQVADYFATYPTAVEISDALYTSSVVDEITRSDDGFFIAPYAIRCKNIVLATGIFSVSIAPPLLLGTISNLDNAIEPLLVIGSGFSAADVIMSVSPCRKLLHLFRWAPDTKPSPLRGCHHQAYPEYAGIYRQMKLAAMSSTKPGSALSPFARKRSNPFFNRRDWASVYEGFPNAEVIDVKMLSGVAKLHIRLESGDVIDRTVGGMAYVVGRRGRLNYLDKNLRHEVLGTSSEDLISGRTLRTKAEADLEVAPNVFIIGSLTGDSLIRHSFGSCLYAASSISGARKQNTETSRSKGVSCAADRASSSCDTSHHDLHIDRRKISRTLPAQTA